MKSNCLRLVARPQVQVASVVVAKTFCTLLLLLAAAASTVWASDPFEKPLNKKLVKPRQIDKSVKRSVDWLLDFCLDPLPVNAAQTNDGVKQTVALFQTAFLLEMMPDLFHDDPRREKVLAAAHNQLEEGAGCKDPFFTSWINGFVTIYALEKSTRSGTPHPALQSLAESWIDRQNTEGGWSHGSAGRMVDIYPSTILSASNFALIGLGAIKEFDHEFQNSVDFEDVVEEAIAMYEKSQSSRGGLPYGARSYQKGVQSGRTATSLIGMVALGLADSDLFCRAVHYSAANIENVPFGHASPAMHVGCGGLAFAMLGGDHWQQFQQHHFQTILDLQNEDGTFGDITGNGPDSFLGNKRISTAYRTALYTICLKADQSEFIKRLQKRFDTTKAIAKGNKLVLDAHPIPVIPVVEAKAASTAKYGLGLAAGEKLLQLCEINRRLHAAVISSNRKGIRWVDVESGETSHQIKLQQPLRKPDLFFTREKLAVIVTAPEQANQVAQIGGAIESTEIKFSDGNTVRAVGIDIASGATVWGQQLPLFRHCHVRETTADFLSTNGKTLWQLDLKTGEVVFTSPTGGEITSAAVFGIEEGPTFVGGMGKVIKHDESGEEAWTSKMRGKRGMIQPSAISVAAIDDQVFVSTTYASIFCFDADSGKLNWKFDTDGLVSLEKNADEQLFAVGVNGTVHRLEHLDSKPKVAWSTNIGVGLEFRATGEAEAKSHDFRYFTTPGKLIGHDRIENKFYVLDAGSGMLLSQGEADQTFYASGYLATVSKDTIKFFDLQ